MEVSSSLFGSDWSSVKFAVEEFELWLGFDGFKIRFGTDGSKNKFGVDWSKIKFGIVEFELNEGSNIRLKFGVEGFELRLGKLRATIGGSSKLGIE